MSTYSTLELVKRRLLALGRNLAIDTALLIDSFSSGLIGLPSNSSTVTLSAATFPAGVDNTFYLLIEKKILYPVLTRDNDTQITIDGTYKGPDYTNAEFVVSTFQEIKELIDDTSGEVDDCLEKVYNVSFPNVTASPATPNIIQKITTDLVAGFILERWYAANTPEDSDLANRLVDDARAMLKDMTSREPSKVLYDYLRDNIYLDERGRLIFGDDTSEADDPIAGLVWSNNENNSPKFDPYA